MTGPVIQGWCPGALRPMASGDGLVVRIRPRSGRLLADQLAAIAELSLRHGNGLVDFSARGNLQLRGVREDTHAPLIEGLALHDLVDDDVATESSRNILVTPFWSEGDGTIAIAERLAALLADCEGLPGKFGFAIDTAGETVLGSASADIRIERGAHGGLILRADGQSLGVPVEEREAAAKAADLARWFMAAGGVRQGRGRMRDLLARGTVPPHGFMPCMAPSAARHAPRPRPGIHAQGALFGFPFGQSSAADLLSLAGQAPAFRTTPWRMLLAEGLAAMPHLQAIVTRADDPLLRIHACTGQPGCNQALQPVRPLAMKLARHLPQDTELHLSGCAKGCAHPEPCDVVLTASRDGFGMARNARAGETAAEASFTAANLSARPRDLIDHILATS